MDSFVVLMKTLQKQKENMKFKVKKLAKWNMN